MVCRQMTPFEHELEEGVQLINRTDDANSNNDATKTARSRLQAVAKGAEYLIISLMVFLALFLLAQLLFSPNLEVQQIANCNEILHGGGGEGVGGSFLDFGPEYWPPSWNI
jgi:hypothetical protein